MNYLTNTPQGYESALILLNRIIQGFITFTSNKRSNYNV